EEPSIEGAGIGVLHHNHALVGAELDVELGRPDVHRIDPSRAPLQEAVRESPRGGPHVQANLALDVDREVFEGMSELIAAPTHEALSPDQFDVGSWRYQGPHLVDALPVDKYLPGHDPAGCPLATGDQPLLDEQTVDADALGHDSNYRHALRRVRTRNGR